MTSSPIENDHSLVSVEVLINGSIIKASDQLMAVEVDRKMNKIAEARFSLKLQANDDNPFSTSESDEFVPGNKVEIKAGYDQRNETIFKGVITRHSLEIDADGLFLEVYCRDEAVKMTGSVSSKYFKDEKDSELITALANDAGLTAEVSTTPYQHPVLVKHQTTDWNFILHRASANSLLINTQDGKLVVAPAYKGNTPLLSIEYGKDIFSFQGAFDVENQSPEVFASSWEQATQTVNEAQAVEPAITHPGNFKVALAAKSIGYKTVHLHTPAHLDESEIQEWADAQLLNTRFSMFSGEVKFQGNSKPQLNRPIELKGVGKRFSGLILVTGIQHTIEAGNWQTTVFFGMKQEWIEVGTESFLPAMSGLHIAQVKEIGEEASNQLKVRVYLPNMDNDEQEVWARMAQPYAGEKRGFHFYPEIDDEVVISFVNNDPRDAVILGCLYSMKNSPAEQATNDNDIKSITTKMDIKVVFNDKDQSLLLQTPGGHEILLSDDAENVIVKDSRGNEVKLSNTGIALDSTADININAAGNISLNATQDLVLNGLNVKANAQVGFEGKGGATAELSSGAQTTVKGAMVMIN